MVRERLTIKRTSLKRRLVARCALERQKDEEITHACRQFYMLLVISRRNNPARTLRLNRLLRVLLSMKLHLEYERGQGFHAPPVERFLSKIT